LGLLDLTLFKFKNMIEKLNEYYINNITGTTQIVTLSEEISCGVFSTVDDFSQEMPANATTKIDFPADGVYQVYVDGVDQGIAIYQKDLFESMIVFISAALCGPNGNCSTLPNCKGENYDYLNNAISKVLLYTSVYNPEYNVAVTTALEKIRCSSITVYERMLKKEKYLGVSSADELLQIELGHFYLELYSAAKANTAPGDYVEFDSIWDYDNISYCIQKLGIMDCSTPAPLPGKAHTVTLTVAPTSIGLGTSNTITATYRFVANDDVFVAVLDTNIPNVGIGKMDGNQYVENIANQTTAKAYYITYSYTRGGMNYQNTVTASTVAYAPQWFGGESTDNDFDEGGVAYVSSIKANISVQPVYKNNSNGTSSNTNTTNKYIWWITTAPIKFYIGAFEILSGPWSNSCDPNSYAIISKAVNTIMEDGVSTQTLYYYRTCPLQNLVDQTLVYELKQ